MKRALCLALLALAACSPKVITRDAPVVTKVPVHSPCVTAWPQKPPPLPDGSHWAQMDVRMKAAALGKHAIELRNYADNLAASTGGCR
jgi:hypothetical protein